MIPDLIPDHDSPLFRLLALVSVSGAAVTGAYVLWTRAIVPGWRLLAEALRAAPLIAQDIGELKQLARSEIPEALERGNLRFEQIEQSLQELNQKLDGHIGWSLQVWGDHVDGEVLPPHPHARQDRS